MANSSVIFLSAFLILCVASAIPESLEKKSRVVDQPLSDETHYNEQEEHNAEYDHEAFLGEEESKTFDQLTPEESRDRLAKIVNKIDVDSDGFVTHDELKEWIHKTQKRYIYDDVKRQWQSNQASDPEKLSWAEYRKLTYGFDSDEEAENDVGTGDGAYNYKDMMMRDKRRWDNADQDKDQFLSKAEFADFLHPEEAEHMKHIVVTETIEDIDKDKDGQISLSEYIGDMYEGNDEAEPDWVKNEREQFVNFRDTNKDGVMDEEEVKAWIIPPDYDHSEAESKHLISQSDRNDDGKLTEGEILDNYDIFVGSQATDYGESLTRHEEL